MSKPIHQEIVIKSSPKQIYNAIIDAKQFAKLTGDPAEISPEEGGYFSCFGGYITGRNIELVPNQRIIQAWRGKDWDDGIYSIVKFELIEKGSETHLVFDHIGFPDNHRDHLEAGWHKKYWEPLSKYLTGKEPN